MDKKNKLSILIVSDTHEEIDNLNKLLEECEKNSYKPDYIFLLGDIVTIPQGEQDNENKYENYYKIINQTLQILEKISPNVIYIPGNHDPKTLFDNDNKIKFGNSSINLHKKKYELNNNLLLIGIGGSITNLISNEKEYYKYEYNINNVEWRGYPYIDNNENPNFEKCEELFKKDLDIIFNYIKDNNKQIILISHNGPFNSSTSNCFEKGKCFYAGSLILDKFIYENKNRILTVLHGHTHTGTGVSTLYNINIFNPGPMKNGHYGKIDLVLKDDKWVLKNITKLRF